MTQIAINAEERGQWERRVQQLRYQCFGARSSTGGAGSGVLHPIFKTKNKTKPEKRKSGKLPLESEGAEKSPSRRSKHLLDSSKRLRLRSKFDQQRLQQEAAQTPKKPETPEIIVGVAPAFEHEKKPLTIVPHIVVSGPDGSPELAENYSELPPYISHAFVTSIPVGGGLTPQADRTSRSSSKDWTKRAEDEYRGDFFDESASVMMDATPARSPADRFDPRRKDGKGKSVSAFAIGKEAATPSAGRKEEGMKQSAIRIMANSNDEPEARGRSQTKQKGTEPKSRMRSFRVSASTSGDIEGLEVSKYNNKTICDKSIQVYILSDKLKAIVDKGFQLMVILEKGVKVSTTHHTGSR